jgi:hypothetical protein
VNELEGNTMAYIPTLVRTPAELRAARAALGLSAEGLARMVLVEDGRTVRRWEAGDHVIPGPVSVLLEIAMDFLRQRDSILQQLEMLQSGKMRSGKKIIRGNKVVDVDDTADTIARLMDAKLALEQALTITTRQPPTDGTVSNQVHWYSLKRATPKHSPPQKDEWSLPGETSCERALAYFERDAGFNYCLELCDEADPAADFILEKREVLRVQFGASQRLRAGDLVERFGVRRA